MRIDADGITVGYRSHDVIHDIGLVLDGPGLVSIIGPNGVGKSTLLKTLNRILEPRTGSVSLNGIDISGLSLKEISQAVAYVSVDPESGFSMTVLETVLMGRHPHGRFGMTSDYDLKVADRVMDMMGISDLSDRRVNELSAGQRQRVNIAKGLAQAPRILLLDEPTANLDVCWQVQITRLLRELAAEEGMTIIMVSHDLNLASRYSDKVIMMAPPGVLHSFGAPEDVITVDSVRSVYGIDCSIVDDHGRPHVILGDPLTDRM